MRSLALAAAVTLVACATAGETASPTATFHGVRRVALIRAAADRGRGARDPLDGLGESLRARGLETRVVELPERRNPPELAAVQRLFDGLELRATTPAGERIGVRQVGDAGREAGDVVARLGVDAVAAYHRLEGRASPRAPEPMLPGLAFPAPPLPERGPVGALSIVDRGGHVAIFPWGATTRFDDPAVPLNPAEAVDLAVRALTGQPPAEEGAEE